MLQNNPELRRALQDPETIRTTMRAMRNPHTRRQLMMNTDRALANIEVLPGGFDAMRYLKKKKKKLG